MSDHNPRHRKSPRLQGYDYSQEGAYFVTVCVQGRLSLFGCIEYQSFIASPAGRMVAYWWQQLPHKFPDVQLDGWVVMPNHFHGILCINRHGIKNAPTSLPDVMRWFKTMTTNAYIRGVNDDDLQPFVGHLWQRSYHDRIIRDESELNRIRDYVANNPSRWGEDTFHAG